jgi:23S rRNA (cytidine1920-2'-O)/16S rRNA (cytidine1409-2'-O)-methyltransferase
VMLLPERRRAEKPGQLVSEDVELELRGAPEFVSRGGIKLSNALDALALDVSGRHALDVGASTGGFTDCLLQAGAARVYAVDAGHGQFRASLAADPRVRAMERTNISQVRIADLDPPIDLAVADLSYLTLGVALPEIRGLFRQADAFEIVALIKPLYEGLRQEDVTRLAAIEPVLLGLFESLAGAGVHVQAACASPLLGGRGAIEFLARFQAEPGLMADGAARLAVEDARASPPVALAELIG